MNSHIPDRRRSEWRDFMLGEVCTKIGSGATPRGGKKTYLQEGPFALIRSQNVYNDGFHHDGLAFISDEQADDLKNVELAEEDVLLNITGDSVARVCQVDPGILPARVNQHVAIVRPDPAKLDAGFLRYYLVSPHVQSILLSWADSGSTRKALTKQMIESFEVNAPVDVSVQRAIAHILGTLDDKIELNRRVNGTLEEMARALFKSWFVDFEPVRAKMEGRWRRGQSLPGMPVELYDLFPDGMVDSELGEIPDGWEVKVLGDVVELNPREPLKRGTVAPISCYGVPSNVRPQPRRLDSTRVYFWHALSQRRCTSGADYPLPGKRQDCLRPIITGTLSRMGVDGIYRDAGYSSGSSCVRLPTGPRSGIPRALHPEHDRDVWKAARAD